MKRSNALNRSNLARLGLLLLFCALGFKSPEPAQEGLYYYRVTLNSPNAYQVQQLAPHLVRVINTSDPAQTTVLDGHRIQLFEPCFPGTQKEVLKKVYRIVTPSSDLMTELLAKFPKSFQKVDAYYPQDKPYYPNDYGASSPLPNYGTGYALYDLDLIRMPEAWGITKGSPKVRIGLSDARIDSTDPDIKGRVSKYLRYYDSASGMVCAHGTNVAGIAIARMDNRYGRPGICPECDVVAGGYGKFSDIEALVAAGARVINASWARCSMGKYQKEIEARIDELYEQGILIVAGAGNAKNCNRDGYAPDDYTYPSSFEKVISVTGVFSRFDKPEDSLFDAEDGYPSVIGLKDRHAREHALVKQGTELYAKFRHHSMQFNESVDICAPTQSYLLGHDICGLDVTFGGATSNTAPYITGVIGLMWSVNYCLDAYETESILKLTSVAIDHLPGNEPYRGKLGAGRVDAYRAVKMARDMKAPEGTVAISGRDFSRFHFRLRHAPNRIKIEKQLFRDSSQVDFTARKQIVLKPGTRLAPDPKGFVRLRIDPDTPTGECEPEPLAKKTTTKQDTVKPLKELFTVRYVVDKEAVSINPSGKPDPGLKGTGVEVVIFGKDGVELKRTKIYYPMSYILGVPIPKGSVARVLLTMEGKQAEYYVKRDP